MSLKSNALFIGGIIGIIVFIIIMSFIYMNAPDEFKSLEDPSAPGSQEFIVRFYFHDYYTENNSTYLTVKNAVENASFDIITLNGNYSYEFSVMEKDKEYSMILKKDFSDNTLYFISFKY